MTWERFKAVEGTETVVIAGEVFKIRKSLKAKEVREIIAKYGNDANAINRALVRKILVEPELPEDDEEFKKLWDDMDAAIQAELLEIAMRKSGIYKLFRLVFT